MLFFSINTFAQQPADFVNPLIGTSNYGATFPGPMRQEEWQVSARLMWQDLKIR